jgi:hypothetical protein
MGRRLRPMESGGKGGLLLVFAAETCDLAVALPKLKVVAVDKLLCRFNRSIIVGAIKLNCLHEVTVRTNDVNSIIDHLRHPSRRKVLDYAITTIGKRLFGPPLENEKRRRQSIGGSGGRTRDRTLDLSRVKGTLSR